MEPKKIRSSYSKKILALLGAKPAVSIENLEENLLPMPSLSNAKHALKRSLRGLEEAGLVETHHSGQQHYSRLTREGKRKAHSLSLDNDTAVFNPHWDGKWRIILLDLPEDRKSEREALRYLLKKAGFAVLKNSVWISPHPFEHLFMNIKKDLGLTTELMIFVTDILDPETEQAFSEILKTSY
jgi:phenylacetic acid degradation operon negative regulatory protein